MSALNEGAILLACGKVTYVGGVPTFTWQNGGFVNAIADTGAGDALFTLDAESLADPTERMVFLQPLGAAGNTNMQYVETSDTQIQVLGFVAAVATDIDFNIQVWQQKLV